MKEENTYNEHIGTNLPDDLRMSPFDVPQGYFDDLENSIHARISEQKLKDNILDTAFTVPEGYFESLQEQLAAKISEQNLKDQVTESGLSVPEGYFEHSQTVIATAIAESVLRDKVADEGYNVPTGYFEDLAQRSISLAKIEQQVSPAEDGFTVPHNYFETLSAHIMDKIVANKVLLEGNETGTPVVKMPSRKSWSQYAAAAVIAIVAGVGSYWALDSSKQAQANSYTQLTLQEISNEEIFNYLSQVTDGVELIELVSFLQDSNTDTDKPFEVNGQVEDQEIEEYLNYML